MELQFYPPGYTPFIDSPSCSATKWCAALTIDSLECTFGFETCNNNCIEPVNFAYLQTNGVPAVPPSPQLTDVSTFTPNRNTLMVNPGDTLVVSISDPRQGFTTVVRDLTTHRTGFMTASATNGFMNTNIADCSRHPVDLPRRVQHRQAAEPGAVGRARGRRAHATGDRPLRGLQLGEEPGPGQRLLPDGQSFNDPNVFDTCVGGSEGPNATGEGPCDREHGHLPERDDPRSEWPGGLSEQPSPAA